MQPRPALFLFFIILFFSVATSGFILPISAQILNINHPVLALSSQLSTSENAMLKFSFTTILLPYLLSVIFLSSASDKYGRFKLILLCLHISCGGYFFLLIGTVIKSVYMPLLGMTFLAIGSAAIPIIQALIADFTDGLKKYYSFGLTAALFTIAYVPSAQLSNHLLIIYPGFISSTSIGVTAILMSLFTLLLGWCLPKHSFPSTPAVNFTIGDIVENFTITFSNLKLCLPLSTLLLFQFSWGLYFQNIYYYLTHYPQYTGQKACFFTTYLCVMTAGILIIVYPAIIRSISLKNTLFFCLLICGVAFLLNTFFTGMVMQYCIGFFIAAGSGMAMPILWNLISDALDKTHQGFLMGLTAIIWVITWTLSSVVGSYLNSYYITLPLQIAAIFMFAAAFRVWFSSRETTANLVSIKRFSRTPRNNL